MSVLGRSESTFKNYVRHLAAMSLHFGRTPLELEPEDTEFIRRFTLHILPSRFVRIRHYGILSSTAKKAVLSSNREQLGAMKVCFIDLRKIQSFNPKVCPCCGKPAIPIKKHDPERIKKTGILIAIPIIIIIKLSKMLTGFVQPGFHCSCCARNENLVTT